MVLEAIRDELVEDMSLPAEKFTVTVLEDPWTELGFVRLPPPINPNPTQPLDFSRPAKVVWATIGLVAVLHGVLFAGLLTSGDGAAHYQRNGLSSGSGKEGVEVISMLSLIPEEQPIDDEKLPSDVTAEPILQPVAPQAVAFGMPNIKAPSIEPPTLLIDNSELEVERTPQVIYRDQIRARIERTWYEINGGARLMIGGCEVKIFQNAFGDVKQVEFQSCIALPAWRTSLERAIRQASPLPAPPEAKLFVGEMTLEF